MSYCRICKAEYGAEKDMKFHKIPKNDDMKKKWIGIIGKVVPASAFVCSRHFSEDQYVLNSNGKKKCLKVDAFPKLNLPTSSLVTLNSSNLLNDPVSQPGTILARSNNNESDDARRCAKFASNTSIFDEGVCEDVLTNDNLRSLTPEKIHNSRKRQMPEEPQTVDPKVRLIENNPESLSLSVELQEQKESVALVQPDTDQKKDQQKLFIPRYLGDFRPEHFVRQEDFKVLETYLVRQRKTVKKLHRRARRWQNKVVEIRNLLSELKKEGL